MGHRLSTLLLLLGAARVAAAREAPLEPTLGPFELRSASGEHAVQVGLAVQLRATYSDGQTAAGAQRSQDLSVEARRVRPMLRGSLLAERVDLFLHLSTAPGALELLDLFAQLNLHRHARLRLGQFKLPYTQHRLQYFTQLQFTDWALTSRYLGAERQMGAALSNGYERAEGFSYAAGVFSGVNARRSHGIGMGLVYGEKLANPSDLATLTPLGTPHPELALHLGYASPGLRPERPSDPARGALRCGGWLSATYDLRPVPALDFSLRLAAEAQLKVRGFSWHGVGYAAFFHDAGGSLQPALYGALTQAGLRLRPRWEVALRYAAVFTTAPLRDDARARAQRLIEATPAATRASVAQQYQAAGTLEEDMDLTLAGGWYLVGNGLKVQFEAAWLHQRVRAVALEGARARAQLQVAF